MVQTVLISSLVLNHRRVLAVLFSDVSCLARYVTTTRHKVHIKLRFRANPILHMFYNKRHI
jgi:hypothetical protein